MPTLFPGKHKTHYLLCMLGNTATAFACWPGQFFSSGSANQISLAGATADDGKCTLCPVGTIQTRAFPHTVRACMPCPAGTAWRNTTSACVACAAGRYKGQTSYSYAFYASDRLAQSTSSAAESDVENAGSLDCEDCPAGRYQQQQGAAHCEACPMGSYTSVNGTASECMPCAAGLFASAPGSKVCNACDWGETPNRIFGSTGCEACMAGQAAKLINGLNACSQCPAGQFRGPLSAPTGCLSCDAGKFQHLSGQSACLDCPPGTYSPESSSNVSSSGAKACWHCAVNTFANSGGSVFCSSCKAGKSTHGMQGLQECLACPMGWAGMNLENCMQCSAGKFRSDAKSSASTACAVSSAGFVQPRLEVSPVILSWYVCTNRRAHAVHGMWCNTFQLGRMLPAA